METKMNFTNATFKEIAMRANKNYKLLITPEEAFLILINGVKYEDLDLYCQAIKEYTKSSKTCEEIYKDIQNPSSFSNEKKELLFYIANITNPLGNHVIKINDEVKINTSSWIKHSLNVGLAAKNISNLTNETNNNLAYILGILHDYGRKYKTDMKHTIVGFESLVNIGLENLAKICLTHSHINGKRCANNEPAVEGWSYANGKSLWQSENTLDDLTKFLINTKYNKYDHIICIADLMATENKIIPVHLRLEDIAKRRKIDQRNRNFFLAELINLLNEFLEKEPI